MKWIKSYTTILLESNEEDLARRLISAVRSRDFERVMKLLNEGIPVDAVDNNGWTPLHYAIIDGNLEFARLLFEMGAQPNVEDRDGLNHIHWAAYTANFKMVKLVLDNGAEVDVIDDEGMTPLQFSVTQKKIDLSKLFINRGADPVKAFKTFEDFSLFFGGDLSWYRGDLPVLQRRFKATEIRRKLF